jgi:rhamnosyltransferase
LKRRPFFHDPLYHELNAIRLRRAYDLLQRNSTYDTNLIWKDVLTASKLRTLHTNVELLEILDDKTSISPNKKWPFRVAVLAHIFYPDMTKELVSYADNIPQNFDLIITTDTDLKVDSIREQVAGFRRGNVIVRKVVDNRGRDTSALLIACRDIVLSGQYDLVCRIHSKKSPQDGANLSEEFKRHLLDNILHNRSAVGNILDLFEQNERLGVIIPPIIHIGYPTMGWAWFNNREIAQKVADLVKIKVDFDDATPIAAYGGMFWFRPEAVKKLFLHEWQYVDFNEEPAYGDGDLPHALERMYCYCAQDAGYFTMSVLAPRQAARSYVKMEYKLQLLSSHFQNGAIMDQIRFLQDVRGREGIRNAVRAAIARRYPKLFNRLAPYYRSVRRFFARGSKTESR